MLAAGGAAAAVLVLHPLWHTANPAVTNRADISHAAGPSARGPAGGASRPAAGSAAPSLAAPATASIGIASPAGTARRTAVPAATPPAAQAAPARQQANQVAGLLAQSASDRGAVVQAVADVNDCGPGLSADAATFSQAAQSRSSLIGQLQSLDTSALPGGMIDDLTSAWQASEAADQDFVEWADDEIADGCTPDDGGDPGYQASVGPDDEATTDKEGFTALWNPLASEYGLTAYQWDQL